MFVVEIFTTFYVMFDVENSIAEKFVINKCEVQKFKMIL